MKQGTRITADYVVVGAGLTGATIARALADAGREVVVLERRPEIAGNVHDSVHPSGIRIHTYGPHYFRTNSDRLWEYVSRFAEFHPYEACLKVAVNGHLENWPVAGSYMRRAVGENWEPAFSGSPKNFEEACLKLMPRPVYETFVKGYTEKQWGISAKRLSAALVSRFDVRHDDEPRLSRHKYQGIPLEGYSSWVGKMLLGIPAIVNFDYLRNRAAVTARKRLVFTGPVDEFFGFDLGKLAYRAQSRALKYYPDAGYVNPAGQINYPTMENPAIRVIEWKHMMPKAYASRIVGSVTTTETPFSPANPEQYEYPFPGSASARLYKKYAERARSLEDVLICGRLGEYRYYDMDQAIARALTLGKALLQG